MRLFDVGMSFDAKLHTLAVNGGPFLVEDGFSPNGGVGVTPYPAAVAPKAAIEVHMAANQRKRRPVILPLAYIRSECAAEGLALHLSNVSIANKPDACLRSVD